MSRNLLMSVALGLVAVALGWRLVSLGRAGDEAETNLYRAERIDAPAMLKLVETLSSDALEGRFAGSVGNEAARGFIRKKFETIGLRPMGEEFDHVFPVLPRPDEMIELPDTGVNLVGWLPGMTPGEGPMIVVTAHYDHLGIREGEIYNGADDNASGVGALIAVAQHMARVERQHDIVFAALDVEEFGLLGARALVRGGALDLERVALNVNFDMVSRSDVDELYVAGLAHSPRFERVIDTLAADAPITLLKGHDTDDWGEYGNWTMMSDHAAFHEVGIPFLYFGVEDHAAYHKPSDDFAHITHDFYVRAVDTLALAVERLDAELGELEEE